MGESFQALGESVVGIVTSAISGEWGELAKSIISTVSATVDLGSAAIDGSSAGAAGEAGADAAGADAAGQAGSSLS